MSRSVKTFLRGAVWTWLVKNAQLIESAAALDKERFFIVPLAPGDPGYGELTKTLIQRFSASKSVAIRFADEYVFRLLMEGDDLLVLASRIDGIPLRIGEAHPFELEKGDATFLQRMDFITAADLSAPAVIPARLLTDAVATNSAVFENDLEPYLPSVTSWRISKGSDFYGDSFEVICVRVLINIVGSDAPARRFSGLLVQLALAMPVKDHDWLFEQLYFALTSRKSEHLFLGLYQLLEFFFPLRGIAALKQALGFNGSFLQLREHCSNALGWNINHHTGARAAAQLCSEAFADICLGRALPANSPGDVIEKHKVDAIGKISELRHLLAHQSFAARKADEEGLNVKTEALLSLLIEAFTTYRRHH